MTGDSCTEKWSERDWRTHTHTYSMNFSYQRSYTSERVQGSVWNWVKVTGDVTCRSGRKEQEKEVVTGDREK